MEETEGKTPAEEYAAELSWIEEDEEQPADLLGRVDSEIDELVPAVLPVLEALRKFSLVHGYQQALARGASDTDTTISGWSKQEGKEVEGDDQPAWRALQDERGKLEGQLDRLRHLLRLRKLLGGSQGSGGLSGPG